MAIYPKAIWKPLPENKSEPRLSATIVALHSAVTSTKSLFGYFSRDSVKVESHFYVREDGTVEQYIDTDRQADAQREGNDNCISVETWDGGKPDTVPWNPAQMRALAELIVWCSTEHPIPIGIATGPNGRGVGYHSQFRPDWARDGRTCPGRVRVPQVQIVIRDAVALKNGKPVPLKPKPKPPVTDTLARGSEGYRVRVLQAGLNRVFPAYSRLRVDGSFGPATESVVKEFQRRSRLERDGRVGPLTRKALARVGIVV